jgi:uncharacterized RDD family membrane protein YckC
LTYCKYCGKEISKKDEFCKFCGKPQNILDSKTKNTIRYASIGERFVGVLIDSIIVAIIAFIIMLPFGLLSLIWNPFSFPIGWFFGSPQLLLFTLWILYFSFFESTSGQTIGKRIIGIKVVNKSNQVIDLGSAVIRNILRIIDWLPFFYIVGFVLVSTSIKRQRLGDYIAKTIVIKT